MEIGAEFKLEAFQLFEPDAEIVVVILEVHAVRCVLILKHAPFFSQFNTC